MIRRFLAGVFWGGAVAALGLGAVSQLTPLPVSRIAADAATVQRTKPKPVEPVVAVEEPIAKAPAEVPVIAPEPTARVEPAVEPVPPTAAATDQLTPPSGSEFARPLPDLDPVLPATETAPPAETPEVAPLNPIASDEATATDAPSVAPKTGLEVKPLDNPADTERAAVTPTADGADQIALAEPDQPIAPQADAPPAPTPDPPAIAKPDPEAALPKPLPQTLPVPDTEASPSAQLAPDTEMVPDSDPVSDPAIGDTGTLAPTPGLDGSVSGVTTGRLPRIGDAALPADGDANSAAGAGIDTPIPGSEPTLSIETDVDLPPLQKFAGKFANPDAKPLFAIILIDTGGAALDRAALAALPFPITFALDPLAEDVAVASKIYRDAGKEVIMVATGIPTGATAADLEVTFQAHAAALPEAVAVIDTEFGAFQADRPLATQVVPILKAQGRGLISWDRGLNAADQVARREGLAATMVFRKLDGKGENSAAVRRALDRAAFKAAQDGRVTVIGQTIPETIAALQEWSAAGRATSVALAPVSAVLAAQ